MAAIENISSVVLSEYDLIALMKRLVIGLGTFALVTGCSPNPEGDGTGSSNISGLEMATTMSVVTPTGGFTGSSALQSPPQVSVAELKSIIVKAITGQIFDPGSDYETDVTNVFVEEDANESLLFANMVLCFLDQTRMKNLVNTGPYTAFLNPGPCIPDLDDVGFFRVVVEAKRAFEHSPQFVNVWVPFADFLGSDWDGGLVVETIIYEEVSATHPVGQFEMKISMELTPPPGEEGDLPELTMNTRTVDRNDGRVEFITFYEQGDPFVQESDSYSMGSANVLLDDPQGNSGASLSFTRDLKVRCEDDQPPYDPIDPCVIDTTQDGYEVIYNPTHLYRHSTGLLDTTEACFDRTTSFYEVDDYGIYFEQDGIVNGTPVTAGQRIDANERFGFEYLGRVGWVDRGDVDWYSGDATIILPDQVVIASTGFNPQDYVVHRSEGALEKRFGRREPVSSITGAPFSNNGGFTGNYPGNPASIASWDGAGRTAADFGFARWRIVINPGTLDFEVVAGETYDSMTGEYTISPVVVPAAVINNPVDGAGNPTNTPLYLRSTGWFDVVYDHSLFPGLPATRYITYDAERERMHPWHSDIYTAATQTGSTRTLYCYNNCLIGGVTAPMPATALTYPSFGTAAPSAAGNINNAVNLPATEGGLRTYQLITDGKKYRLVDMTPIIPIDVELLDTSNVTFSSKSMYNLRETAMAMSDMFHPGLNPGGTIFANNLPPLDLGNSSYEWRTGTTDYYKSFTISQNTAADPVVTFGEKLQFLYQHDIADDLNDVLNFPQVERWDNSLHLMTYHGYFHENFPYFDWPYTSSRNWDVTAINMIKGVVLTDLDGVNYVLKPLDVNELFLEFENPPGTPDPEPCKAVLDITRAQNELTLPTADSVNPMIVVFSDIPIPVNTPPKVVGGVIQ